MGRTPMEGSRFQGAAIGLPYFAIGPTFSWKNPFCPSLFLLPSSYHQFPAPPPPQPSSHPIPAQIQNRGSTLPSVIVVQPSSPLIDQLCIGPPSYSIFSPPHTVTNPHHHCHAEPSCVHNLHLRGFVRTIPLHHHCVVAHIYCYTNPLPKQNHIFTWIFGLTKSCFHWIK